MTVTTWMENRSCGHRRCCSATDKETVSCDRYETAHTNKQESLRTQK